MAPATFSPSLFPSTSGPSASPTAVPSTPPTAIPSAPPTTSPPSTAQSTISPVTLAPITSLPTTPPTAYPTTAPPSTQPTASPTNSSGAPTSEQAATWTSQSINLQFTTISLLDLTGDATYFASFNASFIASVAGGANVAASQVAIAQLLEGSVIVSTAIAYSDADLDAGATPEALAQLLGNSSGIIAMFADSSLLAPHAPHCVFLEASVVETGGAPSLAPTARLCSPVSCADGRGGNASCDDPPNGTCVKGADASEELPADAGGVLSPARCGNSTNGGCDPRVTCSDAPDGLECGPCPAGWTGDGAVGCGDVDECSEGAVCDPLTSCVNSDGGYACTDCPLGYRGSGHTACVAAAASCIEGNGGCDALTSCTETAAPTASEVGSAELRSSCGPCPPGYIGSSDTGCLDDDGCAASPCDPEVLCEDVPAPGLGYVCGECPSGSVGDGAECEADPCRGDANGGCDPMVSCATSLHGVVVCGACPAGYTKTHGASADNQTSCADVDECAAIDRGGCDPLVACINMPGSHVCGDCPEGTYGSGDVRCLKSSSSCEHDNGGCDPLTLCLHEDALLAGGSPMGAEGSFCSACPAGYDGSGTAGCVDEDGCARASSGEEGEEGDGQPRCYDGGCVDVPAPGTGYTCAPCPPRMAGDGVTCVENLCYFRNGGCEASVTCTMHVAQQLRVCGECPPGTASRPDASLSSGVRCVDVDGCLEEPCWHHGPYAQPCEDVPAPGTGRRCGACPPGLAADPSSRGSGCVDVDECAMQANGGCWSTPDESLRSACVNHLGGMSCGPCPAGHIGTGALGCRELLTCADNNGNCDVLSNCTDDLEAGHALCGPCPAGYAGSGDVACVDMDGLVPAMTTTTNGAMKRSATNQIAGSFDGMTEPDCVVTEGVQYRWIAAASDGSELDLDSTAHKHGTPILHLPASTLQAKTAYLFRFTVSLTGNHLIGAFVEGVVEVRSQPLKLLIKGGHVLTGEGSSVVLDATESFDPDAEPGQLVYTWTCIRTDAAGDGYCRSLAGDLLPTRLTSAVLNLTLQGAPAGGADYVFTCRLTKGDRQARASTNLTITRGALPPDTLTVMWSAYVASASGSTPLDLEALAIIDLNWLDLVLAAGSLQAGAEYWFVLTASDAHGSGTAALQVLVNEPPRVGTMSMSPSEGIAGETLFTVEAQGWEDDPEDMPLWYQLQYEVVGAGSGGNLELWTEWQPSQSFAEQLARSGLTAHAHRVTVWLAGRDALEATSRLASNVTVRPLEFDSQASLLDHGDDLLDGAKRNVTLFGADMLNVVSSVAALYNDDAAQQGAMADGSDSNSSNAGTKQRVQHDRELMLEVIADVWAQKAPTTDTATRVAQCAAATMKVHNELTSSARAQYLLLAEDLVEVIGSDDAGVSDTAVGALMDGLGDAAAAAVGGANRSSEVAAGVEVVRALGLSLAQHMVPEEDPASSTSASSTLSFVVQPIDLRSNLSRALAAPVTMPTGATLRLSAGADGISLGASAAGATTGSLLLIGSWVDTHSPTPGADPLPPAVSPAGGARTLDAAPGAAINGHHELVASSSVTPYSEMTSAVMYDASGSAELEVHGLTDAIVITLPLTRQPAAGPCLDSTAREGDAATTRSADCSETVAACRFWNGSLGEYRGEGCATLPNPRPPNSSVYWRTTDVSGLPALDAAWALIDLGVPPGLVPGCAEVWDAALPEYQGKDAGYRKYIGEWCQLAEEGNAVGCWWEWRRRAFVGPGCEWDAEASCLCTHLTDFQVQETEVGSVSSPGSVATYDLDSMASADVANALSSTALVAVLAAFMLGGPALYQVSNRFHRRERRALLIEMMNPTWAFCEVQGVWTWALIDDPRELHADIRSQHPDSGAGADTPLQTKPAMMKPRPPSNDPGAHCPAVSIRQPAGHRRPSTDVATTSMGSPTGAAERKPGTVDVVVDKPKDRALQGRDDPRAGGERGPPRSEAAAQPACAEAKPVIWMGPQRHGVRSTVRCVIQPPPLIFRRINEHPVSPEWAPSTLQRAPIPELGQWAGLQFHGGNDQPILVDNPGMSAPTALADLLDLAEPCQHESTPGAVVESYRGLQAEERFVEGVVDDVSISPLDGKEAGRPRALEGAPSVIRRIAPMLRLEEDDEDARALFARMLSQRAWHAKDRAKGDRMTRLLKSQDAARLFELMGVNIPLLLLCVPIDYMHQLAVQHQQVGGDPPSRTAGFSRARRSEKLKTVQGRPSRQSQGRCAKSRAAADLAATSEPLSTAGQQPVLEALSGSETICQVAEGSHDAQAPPVTATRYSLETEVEAGGDAIDGEQRGGPLGQRPAQGGASAGTLPRKNWKKLRQRHMDLSVKRMLGTALVQAFLGIRALVSKEDLKRQTRWASELPWHVPSSHRPFAWYVSVFKVLLKMIDGPGWYERSHLWNLIFLQQPDGSFELSQHLATVLRSGEPLESLESNPVAHYDLAVLQATVPEELSQVYEGWGHDEESNKRARDELWATLLVLQELEHYPCSWTENPEEAPRRHVTLAMRSEMFVASQQLSHAALKPLMPRLRAHATELSQSWKAQHQERVIRLFEKHRPKRRKAWLRLRSLLRRRFWRRTLHSLIRVHPLGAIMLVAATEPYSRSERILVQTNSFMLMFLCTVWFHYSRAYTCCQAFREALSCPAGADVSAPCFGFEVCSTLKQATAGELLPLEAAGSPFECTTFPQRTLLGRVCSVLVMVSIISPVTIILSQIFVVSGTASIPAHWTARPLALKVKTGFRLALMLGYSLFFNVKQFNKALALAFMAFLSSIVERYNVQRAIRTVVQAVDRLCAGIAQGLRAVFQCWGAIPNRRPQTPYSDHEVQVAGALEHNLQYVGHALILVMWVMITWSLLIYSAGLQQILERGEEEEMVLVWAWSLVLELFGMQAIGVMLTKLAMRWMVDLFRMTLMGMHPSMLWYESFVVLRIKETLLKPDDVWEDVCDGEFLHEDSAQTRDTEFSGLE
ncbi:hypothetical protein CYMTET_14134 [Cymbomonas tetramitiformis]|uniref:Uncharacterized protein n=1 Tax=Cymbomonas tetramitiformis TaxID=36881 RepID=A0AAE0GGL9_9CHLO|nr:hypothetical protein CYMTET_14134 [Cymbomonas tetramitiformis]